MLDKVPAESLPRAVRVVHWYPNFLGGGAVANAVAALAEAQAQSGAEPLIVTVAAKGAPLYGSLDRVKALLVPWQPSWTLAGGGVVLRGISRSSRALLRGLKPEFVHLHGEFNPDNAWAPRLFDCPCVLSPQGAFNPVVLAKGRRRFKKAYVQAARLLLYRRLAAFHALSPLEVQHILRLAPSSFVYCVPQGPSPFLDAPPVLAPGVERNAVDIITIGRLDVFTKGLDILLEAYAHAVNTECRLGSLVLVGPDWDGGRAQLERYAQSLGIADRIRFIGRVDGTAVGRFLANADIYVQASRHEGFSLSVAEALVAGKPVIMTRENGAAAFREIASLPHVRLVDPQADDLVEAIGDFVRSIEELRLSAKAAQPTISEFLSWERIARVHLAQYVAAAARRP